MRILYITTIGGTMGFFENIIKELLEKGHTVDIACQPYHVPAVYSSLGCRVFPLSCGRSVINKGNIIAIKEIKELVAKENYDIVHCHTPIAAACTRIACRSARKKGLKVIYTAHGFHFYKGSPNKNWLLFFPIEWICSWWTDALITINKEDFRLAQKRMHAAKIEYVPGVGVDTGKLADVVIDYQQKRKELNVPDGYKFILSVGEINANKNHKLVLEALNRIDNDKIIYMIAGQDGSEKEKLLAMAKNIGMGDRFFLLGYRPDVFEIYKAADLFVLPSFREGLSVSTMEALASGVPVLVSNIRGNTDLVKQENVFNPNDPERLAKLISNELKNDQIERNNKLPLEFTVTSVNQQVLKIYSHCFSRQN